MRSSTTPFHPYTHGLLGSIPSVDGSKARRLTVIPGSVPDIHQLPVGCKFVTRCPYAFEPCPDIEPPLIEERAGTLGALSPVSARRNSLAVPDRPPPR